MEFWRRNLKVKSIFGRTRHTCKYSGDIKFKEKGWDDTNWIYLFEDTHRGGGGWTSVKILINFWVRKKCGQLLFRTRNCNSSRKMVMCAASI